MNIYGIGTDIVNVNRIKLAIKKNKNFFKKKIYTDFEIKNCEKKTNKIECYAKRFAAKEAVFKAVRVRNKNSISHQKRWLHRGRGYIERLKE